MSVVGFCWETPEQAELILRSSLLFLCAVLALFSSQNAVFFFCPQDMAQNVFDLPEDLFHSPVFPHTFHKHLDPPHYLAVISWPSDLRPLLHISFSRKTTTVWTSLTDTKMKECTGGIAPKRNGGWMNDQCGETEIKLLPPMTNNVLTSLGSTTISSSVSSSS